MRGRMESLSTSWKILRPRKQGILTKKQRGSDHKEQSKCDLGSRFDQQHRRFSSAGFGALQKFRPTFTLLLLLCIAHLSLPWSIGWVALSFLVRRRRRLSRYGNTRPNLTSSCPTPQNPYIFWKLMIIAIQKWIRNSNRKTKTNTKTMTKTKTPRE